MTEDALTSKPPNLNINHERRNDYEVTCDTYSSGDAFPAPVISLLANGDPIATSDYCSSLDCNPTCSSAATLEIEFSLEKDVEITCFILDTGAYTSTVLHEGKFVYYLTLRYTYKSIGCNIRP